MRTKIFKTNCRSCQSHHTILKQEANSLREENRSLLTAIRLMSNELQNPNEGKYVPVTSTNLHEQISECVNGVSPMHDKESPWVSVNNAKSKQRSKRKRSKKAKLTATANPAEPHRPPIEQNQSSHQNRETPNAVQQIQESFFFGLLWNSINRSYGQNEACLHSWGFHYSTRPGLGSINE